jgi:hypothetical protein
VALVAWWLCLGGAAAPGLAADPAALRFVKDLDRSPSAEEQIAAVTLDAETYAATRSGLADLRIFDAQDAEAPYLMERMTETRREQVRRPCAGRVVSLDEKEGGRIEIRLRLDDKAPAAEGLTIRTPLRDYQRRVRVFGSEDEGTTWRPLGGEALIFDYSRFMDIGNSEIPLAENRDRQFRVVVDQVTDQQQSPFVQLTRELRGGVERKRIEQTVVEHRALRIERIDFWSHDWQDTERQDRKADYPVVGFDVEQLPKDKLTRVRVRTHREPLTSLTLATSSRNFSRQAEVQTPVPAEGPDRDTVVWRTIGTATVQLLDFRGFHRQQLTVGFPQQRQAEYRLVIHNEDSPPLDVTGVTAEGDVYRVVFLAQPGKSYRAFFGSPDLPEPHYDTAAVLGPLRSLSPSNQEAVEAKLGPQRNNPAFRAGSAPRNYLNSPWILGGAIVLMVAVLAWALFRAGRRIEQMPGE